MLGSFDKIRFKSKYITARMGVTESNTDETMVTLLSSTVKKAPADSYNLAYIVHFTVGAGYLLPWNAYVTAVDYFSHLYPSYRVDRIFAVGHMVTGLLALLVIIFYRNKSGASARINLGLGLFVMSLVAVPVMDVVGLSGGHLGFGLTVGALCLAGVAHALVQASMIGSAGELPRRYMQATVAGTSASGVLISCLRIFTKAVYPHDAHGLRDSAILYFVVAIVLMLVCLVFYNGAHRLPIMKYYNDLKMQTASEGKQVVNSFSGPILETMRNVKWYGAG